jgi:cupin fold WbuC family metalloprotein
MNLIDSALFKELCEKAEETPRRHAHHLVHESNGNSVQRMLIALQPEAYFRLNRHSYPAKWGLWVFLTLSAALAAMTSTAPRSACWT